MLEARKIIIGTISILILGSGITEPGLDRNISVKSSLRKIYTNEKQFSIFWDKLGGGEGAGEDIYWRQIDSEIMDEADLLIKKYGPDFLFQGLASNNIYSQYYSINRLIEFYSDDSTRLKAIEKIRPFLYNENDKLKKAAEFAIDILDKKFASSHIVRAADGTKIFSLFNNYSDYGSYNELWMIKDDKLSKLYSFKNPQVYIDRQEPIIVSPNKDRIAIKTCSRRSSSINIIDLKTGRISQELISLALEKVSADNPTYINTYPNGYYSGFDSLKWLDNNRLEIVANLSYNHMDIVKKVSLVYNFTDKNLSYK